MITNIQRERAIVRLSNAFRRTVKASETIQQAIEELKVMQDFEAFEKIEDLEMESTNLVQEYRNMVDEYLGQ